MYSPEKIEIPTELMFRILDSLRLAHIYVLKDSHPELMSEDFKPWKWDGYEVQFADECKKMHDELFTHAREQIPE